MNKRAANQPFLRCPRWALAMGFLLLLLGCASGDELDAVRTIHAQFDEVFTIGSGMHDDDILGNPRDVQVDSEGRILVADRDRLSIRVYDEEGTFRFSIGERGEGPGELQDISAMAITPFDEVIVTEGMTSSGSKFTTSGSYRQSWSFIDEDAWIVPFLLRTVQDSMYVAGGGIVLSEWGNDPAAVREAPAPADILHYGRLEDGFSIEESFLNRENDLGYDDDYSRTSITGTGSLLVLESTEILYAPRYYDGRVFHFVYDEANNRWNHEAPWSGIVATDQPYDVIALDEEDREDTEVSQAHGPLGSHAARINNRTAGLVALNDGTVAHFTIIRVDGELQFGVELFDEGGQLIGYGPIDAGVKNMRATPPIPSVRWKDDGGRLYMIDYLEDNAPVVRVVKLEVVMAES